MLLDLDQLIEKYKMDIRGIYHVGAHHGQEYEVYKKYGIKNIIFFEPVYRTFKILEARLYGEPVTLVNAALSNQKGRAKMFLEKQNEGQSSSLLKSKLHSDFYPHITFEEETEVDVLTLDEYMKGAEVDKYNFLSLDTQGSELMVLQGAREVLNHVDYIMTEVNSAELYEGCAQIEQLDEFLKPYGFERVETYWVPGKYWGDSFYIKN